MRETLVQNHMRLDDLLTRNLEIQWFEGVAVVQSVCRLAGQSASQDFPLPSDIQIGADGSVAIIRGSAGSGVAGAAHTLARMLGDDVPVRLRLVVAQATGDDGSSSTLAGFSEALAYFERPDAQQILRQLYARANLASPRAEGRAEIQPTRVVAERPAPAPPPARRSVTRTAILTIAVAALCAAVWVAGFGDGSGTLASSVATLKGALAVPAGTPPADSTATDAAGSTRAQGGRRTRSPRTPGLFSTMPAGRPLAAAPDEGHSPASIVSSPSTTTPPGPSFTVPGPPVPVFADAEPIVVFASAFGAPERGRLYSREDASVTPPRSVYPTLPTAQDPVAGTRSQARTVLELTVASDGSVERVRLQSPPRNIHEFMLLSAAKAWRFQPAIADGRPVRFLYRVAIAAH